MAWEERVESAEVATRARAGRSVALAVKDAADPRQSRRVMVAVRWESARRFVTERGSPSSCPSPLGRREYCVEFAGCFPGCDLIQSLDRSHFASMEDFYFQKKYLP